MANIFPKWTNKAPLYAIIALSLLGGAGTAGVTYFFTPKYTDVGYQPTQPVSYDHSLHVGRLGLDCRYCHTYVDRSEHANVPDSGTCMNCHNQILPNSPKLAPIRESYQTGNPVPWVRVHKMPDFVYFDHAVHVNRGVSCVECHGQINEMKVVEQAKSLSMDFCLSCHRNPEENLRPLNQVYNLDWKFQSHDFPSHESQLELGRQLVDEWKINPPKSCSRCHR